MSDSWPMVPLGELLTRSEELATIQPEQECCQVTVRLWGAGVVLRGKISGARVAATRQFVVHPEQFILSRIDARNGAFGLVPDHLDGAVVSSDFPSFDINSRKLEPRFLEWMSKTASFVDLCRAASEGTTNRVRLKVDRFLATPIPLPPSPEQRRIVARIEELAALVEEARALRARAQEEVTTLVEMATAELFATRSGDNWTGYHLGDLTTEVRYGTSEKAHNEPTGTPILRMGNIQNGKLDFTDLKYLDLSGQDKGKLLLKPGDILVNRTNSAELVGKCAVFEQGGEYTFASYLIRLRFDLNKTVPQLVAAYINSSIGRAYMFSNRKQMTGQANVNSKTLALMPISLPPVDEQHRIVAYLDRLHAQVGELTALQQVTQVELDALLPSVLERAFRGEL